MKYAIKPFHCRFQMVENCGTLRSIFLTFLRRCYSKGSMTTAETSNSSRKSFGINWVDYLIDKFIKIVSICKKALRHCFLVNDFKVCNCTVPSINYQVQKDVSAFSTLFNTILSYTHTDIVPLQVSKLRVNVPRIMYKETVFHYKMVKN